uniref:Uncharacterized protein n=1 Tax=Parascaris equorum TaxID=6256 RepID=A0A914RSB5_PAREQ
MFDQHCRLAIMDHRIRFPTNRRDSCDSIANLLSQLNVTTVHSHSLLKTFTPMRQFHSHARYFIPIFLLK